MNDIKDLLAQREKELSILKEKEQQLQNQIDELMARRDELESRLQKENITLEECGTLKVEISTLNDKLDELERNLQDIILIEIESLEEEIQSLKRK